jgi:hypothetical protein
MRSSLVAPSRVYDFRGNWWVEPLWEGTIFTTRVNLDSILFAHILKGVPPLCPSWPEYLFAVPALSIERSQTEVERYN